MRVERRGTKSVSKRKGCEQKSGSFQLDSHLTIEICTPRGQIEIKGTGDRPIGTPWRTLHQGLLFTYLSDELRITRLLSADTRGSFRAAKRTIPHALEQTCPVLAIHTRRNIRVTACTFQRVP